MLQSMMGRCATLVSAALLGMLVQGAIAAPPDAARPGVARPKGVVEVTATEGITEYRLSPMA